MNKFEHCHVIAGFPGIGKSTVAKKFADSKNTSFTVVDFDSAMFKANMTCEVKEFNVETGEFDVIDNFAYAYVREIRRIMENHEKKASSNDHKVPVLIILCSTHDTVLEQLHRQEIPHTIVIPGGSVTAKNIYVKRLQDRYEDSVNSNADEVIQNANKRAFEAVQENYYAFVDGIRNNCISQYAQLVVLGDNEYLGDYIHSVTTGNILGKLFNSMGVSDVGAKDIRKHIFEDPAVSHFTMGSHGEFICWTDAISRELYDRDEILLLVNSLTRASGYQSENSAFAGCPYVMIKKDMARGLLKCLNSAIERLRSGTRDDDDVEVFGDDAIYYERLIDALDGLSYMHYHAKKKKEEKDKEREERRQKEIANAANAAASPLSVIHGGTISSALINKEDRGK